MLLSTGLIQKATFSSGSSTLNGIAPLHELHPDDLPWANIRPDKDIIYHPCYDNLQCARLLVPMDWNSTQLDDGTVAIAIVRVPAKVPVTDPSYGGAVFINPGGPGASGTQEAVREGRQMQALVDATADETTSGAHKYFDIIGFDPRGVRQTSPRLICFPDYHARRIWEVQSEAEGTVAASDVATAVKKARWSAMSKSCLDRAEKDPRAKVIYHLNTTPVVRDLLEMVEKHAEWREKTARSWLGSPVGRMATMGQHADHTSSWQSILARTSNRGQEEKLNFSGQSYGTFMGAMFAAMYPSRVGSMVLDSVKLPAEGLAGTRGSSIIHADEIVKRLFDLCYGAGPEKCEFHSAFGPAAMQDEFDQLLEHLQISPLSVSSTDSTGPEIITWSDVTGALRSALYNPMKSFPNLVRLIASVSRNDGTYFAKHKQRTKTHYNISPECAKDGPFSPSCMLPVSWEDEVNPGVSCSDADHNGLDTVENFDAYLKRLESQSKYIAKPWAELNMKCAGWTAKAKWRFTGPFTANTSNPILILNNLLDPVTPVENAIEVSKSYPGSVVLKQNGIGHITIDTRSACTTKYIRRYFQTGQLPPANTTCEVDERPFGVNVQCTSDLGAHISI
ncbi:proteinase [Elsinoe ampelina]|uniref:Proteinase n=1 Tax=Elsinoe ampelina TaxID=302913 RepID=A0A6A6GDP5_9PEZI|nr:proteinase [Elsinoe ampelina]